jgi:phosphoribosyl-ATP pyrophosphohydrolase/phosphoribosyl-AMP cyclohydrolase
MSTNDLDFLATLESIIADRIANPSEESYTASLAERGTKRMAQKVGEEGVELALAAVDGDRDEIANEAADLIYHVLVLLSSQGVALAEVVANLKSRHLK